MQLRTFSYGGGVQSTACLVLAALGKIDFPYFLFSNVGDDSENPETIKFVNEYAMPYAKENNIELIELRKIGKRGKHKGEERTLYGDVVGDNKSIRIPIYMAGGAPGRRSCTTIWKRDIISDWQEKNGATEKNPAVCGLGISIDEYTRVRTSSGIEHQVIEYPLIDMGLDRNDCASIIAESGLPVPPKSSCWFCPFKRQEQWLYMYKHQPDLFEKAVKLEETINSKRNKLGKDRVYLHFSRTPLESAVGNQMSMLDIIEEDACSFSCFT